MKKKILVIGSNSFSGSDFMDYVIEKNNYTVIGISRSPEKSSVFLPYKRHKNSDFSFFQLDLNKNSKEIVKLVDNYKPDYIVNFAAQSEVAPSWEHPEHWFETNVVALAKLCNHLLKVNYLKKFLQVSSPEVYGACEGVVKEDAPLNPSTPYAASKAAADLFLFTLVKNFKFPVVFVRSTNVYGAHQQLFKIIPRTVINIRSGKKIELHGGGKAVKSYIYIRDISKGEYAILTKGKIGEIYHLSPKEGVKVRNVVKLICRLMGADFAKVTKNVEERLGQDKAYVIDSTKARKEFGWRPKVSLEEGLNGVINWIDQNWSQIKKMPLVYIHKA